jgi:hypothetical protein
MCPAALDVCNNCGCKKRSGKTNEQCTSARCSIRVGSKLTIKKEAEDSLAADGAMRVPARKAFVMQTADASATGIAVARASTLVASALNVGAIVIVSGEKKRDFPQSWEREDSEGSSSKATKRAVAESQPRVFFSTGDWVGGSADATAAQPLGSDPGEAVPVVGTSLLYMASSARVLDLRQSDIFEKPQAPLPKTIAIPQTCRSRHERKGRKPASDTVAADKDAQLALDLQVHRSSPPRVAVNLLVLLHLPIASRSIV